MGWDGGGCGRGGLSRRKFLKQVFGQNPAFWFISGKKMCFISAQQYQGYDLSRIIGGG